PGRRVRDRQLPGTFSICLQRLCWYVAPHPVACLPPHSTHTRSPDTTHPGGAYMGSIHLASPAVQVPAPMGTHPRPFHKKNVLPAQPLLAWGPSPPLKPLPAREGS